jgi:LuxR family maltose regulon positive regulatory protein
VSTDTVQALHFGRRRPRGAAAEPTVRQDAGPPRLPAGIVPRAALVRRLLACRDAPVATIVAPAGYGKTALLAEWAMRDDRPFSWPALDGGDGAATTVRSIEEAAASGAPQVIVLDDAALAPADAVADILQAAARLPRGVMLAVASRGDLPAPIGRLRAHRLMLEITRRDLAMGRLEAAMLLDGAGLRLDAEQVDLLLARTEGWPAALYLAALSVADASDAGAAIAAFDGADRFVAEYVHGELLAQLAPSQRTLLRRSSILDTLSAPLCDAVAGARGSATAIEQLLRAGLPIERADRQGTVFRCHPLLVQALRAELARVEPGLDRTLHRRAAVWLAREGQPAAIHHAIASRDARLAGSLMWSLAPAYALDGRETTLAEWLRRFLAREIVAHAPLALTAAVCHVAQGRRIEALRAVEAAERALQNVPSASGWMAATALLRAGIARHGMRQMADDAARACEQAPPGGAWQSLGLLLGGIAQQLAGDAGAARDALEEAAVRTDGRVAAVAAVAHAQLALIAADLADWDEAERQAQAASASLSGNGAPRPVHALILAVTAVVAANRGETERASRDAAGSLRLVLPRADFPPWLLAETHVWLARAEIRLSDGPTARMLLNHAARLQAQVPDAPVLARWVHDGWARADAFAASAGGDGPALTNAELRVLRLLESCMSFREIGERLHVSPNTVKTQALAVYRKLNVSCRSDAVSRGRVAGLIGG